ncbi:hypothetical protein PSACC_02264 [Paramicrosporidium saccamoebae]|uniref:Zinc finger C2H2 LYAR-type domain-containing protein n=1 Tax=Paramicrosporidium saccamoebae TaxID=1246581 RepID=A0A2H9TJQ8_9FUNG|nr:hypothetical protein PSACC_02264 [Paramicrosporidium saccamoebae]
MPSFVCDACQETLKKPKLDMHAQRCRQASFSCIDCYKSFKGVDYRQHFSCITEVEKYEKKKLPVPVKMVQPPTVIESPVKTQTQPDIRTSLAELLQDNSLSISSIKKVLKKSPYSFSKKAIKKHLEKSLVLSVKKGKIQASYTLE